MSSSEKVTSWRMAPPWSSFTSHPVIFPEKEPWPGKSRWTGRLISAWAMKRHEIAPSTSFAVTQSGVAGSPPARLFSCWRIAFFCLGARRLIVGTFGQDQPRLVGAEDKEDDRVSGRFTNGWAIGVEGRFRFLAQAAAFPGWLA